MKKIFLSFVMLSSTILCCNIFAQNENMVGNTGGVNKQIQAGMTMPDQTKLSYINISFCNDGLNALTKNGLVNIRPGQTKEICMVFSNVSEKESADIVATFVDTELSNEGNMVCSLGINNTGKMLASYISFDKEKYSFTLAPGETVVKKAMLHMPKDAELGVYNSCVGYQLDIKKKDDDKGIFFVVRRRVGLMEITVQGDVYKLGRLDNIKYIYKNNKVMILKGIARIIGIILLRYVVAIIRGDKNKHKKIKEKK